MKTRRDILGGLAVSGVFSTFAQPVHALPRSRHPFAGLRQIINRNGSIDVGGEFQPSQQYALVVFMTAQNTQPSCGATFLAMRAAVRKSDCKLRAIMIMPRFSDQTFPQATENLRSALASENPVEVYSGNLNQILRQASAFNMPFTLDNRGKVEDHSPDVVMIDNKNRTLFRDKPDINPFFGNRVSSTLSQGNPRGECQRGLYIS